MTGTPGIPTGWRARLWLKWRWLLQGVRRGVQSIADPESWLQAFLLVLSIAWMTWGFLDFFWWLGHLVGAR